MAAEDQDQRKPYEPETDVPEKLPEYLQSILAKAIDGINEENILTPPTFGRDIDALTEEEGGLLRQVLQKEMASLQQQIDAIGKLVRPKEPDYPSPPSSSELGPKAFEAAVAEWEILYHAYEIDEARYQAELRTYQKQLAQLARLWNRQQHLYTLDRELGNKWLAMVQAEAAEAVDSIAQTRREIDAFVDNAQGAIGQVYADLDVADRDIREIHQDLGQGFWTTKLPPRGQA